MSTISFCPLDLLVCGQPITWTQPVSFIAGLAGVASVDLDVFIVKIPSSKRIGKNFFTGCTCLVVEVQRIAAIMRVGLIDRVQCLKSRNALRRVAPCQHYGGCPPRALKENLRRLADVTDGAVLVNAYGLTHVCNASEQRRWLREYAPREFHTALAYPRRAQCSRVACGTDE